MLGVVVKLAPRKLYLSIGPMTGGRRATRSGPGRVRRLTVELRVPIDERPPGVGLAVLPERSAKQPCEQPRLS